jgi:hypothetical protein
MIDPETKRRGRHHYGRRNAVIGTPPVVTVDVCRLKEMLLERRKITATGCWEWPRAGYSKITIAHNTKVFVHRLAAHLWLGMSLDSDLDVCHTCDNPPCFNPEHLFTGTHLDNMKDAADKGKWDGKRILRGEELSIQVRESGTALRRQFMESEILEIRERYAAGETQRTIACAFDTSQAQVHYIVTRKTWTHV